MTKKEIKEYILRIIAFLVLIGSLHNAFAMTIFKMFDRINAYFYQMHPIFAGDINNELAVGIIEGLFCLFLSYLGVIYFFAKICGLFKKLDSLNKWKSFLIIFALSVFCLLFAEFLHKYRLMHIDNITSFDFTGYLLIPSYLLYKFFNRLTKKYSFFQKIGYYSSIEFFKDLYLKIRS